MFKTSQLAHLTSVCLASLMAAPLAAQSLPAEGAGQRELAAADDSADIVVTANRRSQALTDVGLAMSVLDSSQLDNRQVSSVSDLAALVPGLSIGDSGYATPIYSLRGVGVNEPAVGAGSSVTVYVDEVPLTLPIFTRGASFDLERIEVVKGPQGTLYGQNATGGAINYIASKPTDNFEARIKGSYGRFNAASLEGFISGPLSDTLSGRIAARGERADGWQKSITRDDSQGKVRKFAGRAMLEWQPGDDFRALLNFNGWKDRSDTQAPQLIRIVPNNPAVAPFPFVSSAPLAAGSPRTADWDRDTDFDQNAWFYQGSLRMEYDIADGVTLTSLTAYSKFRNRSVHEADGIGYSAALGRDIIDGRYDLASDANSFTQEVRLSASFSIINFVIGANYQRDNVNDVQFGHFDDFSIISNFFGVDINSTRNLNNQRIRGYGVFGNLEAELTDYLTISGGLRINNETRSFKGCSADSGDGNAAAGYNGFTNFLRGNLGLPPLSGSQIIGPGECISSNSDLIPAFRVDRLEQSNVPWNVNVNFKPFDRSLIYARVSRGFKAGNYPSLSAGNNAVFTPVSQEKLLAYELGFRSNAIDGLSVEGAIFRYEYTDKQQRGRKDTGFPFGLVATQVNIPESRIQGAELSATLRPVTGLTLSGSAVYVDTEIKRYTGFSIEGPLVDMKGLPLNFSPKWSVNLDANYSVPITSSLNLFGGAGLAYRSKTTSQLAASSLYDIDAYTLINAQLGVEDIDGRWRLWAYGNNITNEYYWTNVVKFADTVTRFTGMPATYGVSFAYNFK
ncbi:TonB-dependent receptor [Rhizorhapis suberifaciens]|uniref:Outer membrane receptor protein involved in Fe transport n=1 Tax=Rhizorhapis suberifaciens TaxID=13656 RepID=A0A840HRH5_9SPHN|nr:TonB-dependent receptor [Rhizorhapis suberifaciens]MBB4640156.1 outer membrane receptor protein involved in Fe transport [Rhizorhapis suberifaciens]